MAQIEDAANNGGDGDGDGDGIGVGKYDYNDSLLNVLITENYDTNTNNNTYRDSVSALSLCSIGANSSGANTNSSMIDMDETLFTRHSDFTIPTSNNNNNNNNNNEEVIPHHRVKRIGKNDSKGGNDNELDKATAPRRSLFGVKTVKKYHFNDSDRRRILSASTCSSSPRRELTPVSYQYNSNNNNNNNNNNNINTTIPILPTLTKARSIVQQHQQEDKRTSYKRQSSRIMPKILPVKDYPSYHLGGEHIPDDNKLHSFNYNAYMNNGIMNHIDIDNKNNHHDATDNNKQNKLRESLHLQSLLLGLAFMVIWLPNNMMAPNLTQMAEFFHMNDIERDLYLGSYCALALGVFSLPLSGLIGFMADFYSRKHLFVACIIIGALSSAWSGWAPNYINLFLARLCSGGCMSGSVSVTFSMLGDLFSKEERNAASSGLTSMMGLGIILGQIFAGEVGPSRSWQYPFYVSAFLQLIAAIMIAVWVSEPIRGGKEHALQDMFKAGKKYEQQLSLDGFFHAMHENTSNWILLWQGFLTSLPWGIVFVFLNDYLSQEKGFSVQQATFLVMLFGVGCAIGGITGGWMGQLCMRGNRSFLPIYMGISTFLGIFPFVALLNSEFPHHNSYKAKLYSVLGGCIASLPSVNIRPCIINVNPPESRGAALTAANLLVTLGRGMGPSCIVLLGTTFHFTRQMSFNITLVLFWTVSAIQLLFLAKTLPKDQDAMEEKLVQYAAAAQGGSACDDTIAIDEHDNVSLNRSPLRPGKMMAVTETTGLLLTPRTPPSSRIPAVHDEDFVISSPDYNFHGKAARQSLQFVSMGIKELGDEIIHRNQYCRGCETVSPSDSNDELFSQIDPSNEGRDKISIGNLYEGLIPENLLPVLSQQEVAQHRQGDQKNGDIIDFLKVPPSD